MEDRFSGRHWQLLVLAAATVLLFVRLGSLDLWAPDEPRYAQVAEEVRRLDRGAAGLFLLSLNGEVYDQKPPLYYWLAALAGTSEGRVTEWAARAPSAFAGLALVAATIALGRRLFGAAPAALGGLLLLTAGLFPHLARRSQLDVLLALFEMLALAGFWRLDRGIGSRRSNLLLMHGAMGLGVLTKGPVGFLVPALVVAGFLAWEGRLRALPSAFPVRALALSVLPGVAWIALATLLAPEGFFHTAVVDNIFGRFFDGTSKVQPWHYLIRVFPLGFAPWSLLWPLVLVVGRRQVFAAGADEDARRAWRFLLVWVGGTLLFFTLSSGKRDLYLLPCYPAAALLCADAATRSLRGVPSLPRLVARGLAGVAAALAIAALALAVAPLIPGVDVPIAFALAVLAVLGATIVAWPRVAGPRDGALAQLGLVAIALGILQLATFTLFYPALEPQKSPRLVAEAAAALVPPGEPIGLVESAPFVGGLAYYSGRPVREVGPAQNLRAYFESGGRVAVVRAGALERVNGDGFAEVRARFRTGDRSILVVVPRAPAPAPPGSGTPPADGLAHR